MTKTELIKEAATKLGATEKSVSETMNCLLETIAQALEKGEAVRLLGFGTFERKERAARSGFNPGTKEVVQIPASKTVSFKAGKELKDRVNTK